MANKYTPNRYQKFDCPVEGCDRKGRNGFDTPQGIGRHVHTAHGGVATPGMPAKPDADFGASVPAVPRGKIREAFEAQYHRAGALNALREEAPKPTAVQATTAILNLAEVASLSAEALSRIMEHVVALKRLDEDTHDTGFKTDHLDALTSRRAPNGELAVAGAH